MAVAEFVYEISVGVAVCCVIFGAIFSIYFFIGIVDGTSLFFPSSFMNNGKAPVIKFLISAGVLILGLVIGVVHCKYMSISTYTDDNYYLDQMVEQYDPKQVIYPCDGSEWDEPSLVEVTMFDNTYWYLYQPRPTPTPTPIPHQEFARDV